MKQLLKTTLQRVAGFLWILFAVSVILVAVLVGLGRILVPHADQVRPHVESILSERLGEPVTVSRLEGEWRGLTPVFRLRGLQMGQGEGRVVRLDSARLEFNLADAFDPARNVAHVVLEGLDLVVRETDEGWRAGVQEAGGEPDLTALRLGDVLLRDANLRFLPLDDAPMEFFLPALRVQREGSHFGLEGVVRAPDPAGGEIELRLETTLSGNEPQRLDAWLGGQIHPVAWLSDTVDHGPVTLATGLDLEVWLAWEPEGRLQVDGRFTARHWPWGHDEVLDWESTVSLTRHQGRTDLELAGMLNNPDGIGEHGFSLAAARNSKHWALAVDQLDLQAVHQLVRPWVSGTVPDLPATVVGRIEELELAGATDMSLHAASGRIRNLGFSPFARVPGMGNLDLDLSRSGDLLAVAPAGGEVLLDWPQMLRGPLRVERLEGRALLGPDLVVLEQVFADNGEVAGTVDGLITFGGGVPFLDLDFRLPTASPAALGPYLPVAIMPDEAVAWLDGSIPHGVRAGGNMQIFGPARGFPYDHGGGVFTASVELESVDLDFHEDWPLAEDVAGRVEFSGISLSAETSRGSIAGVPVQQGRVHIENLRRPVIEMAFDAPGLEIMEVLGFLDRTPAGGAVDYPDAIVLAGGLDLAVAIDLPIGQQGDGWSMDGLADLRGLAVDHQEEIFRLDELVGPIPFSEQGFGPTRLHGRLNGESVTVVASGDDQQQATVLVEGRLSPRAVFPRAFADNPLLEEIFQGSSLWRVQLARDGPTVVLRAESDLRGTGIGLPEPLAKGTEESWALELEVPLQPELAGGSLRLGDRLDGQVYRDNSGDGGRWRLAAGLGGGVAVRPEGDEDFRIEGEAEVVDLAGWGRLASLAAGGGNGLGGELSGRLVLDAGRVEVGNVSLSDVHFELDRDDVHWLLTIAAPAASGQVRFPAGPEAGQIIVADLQHLRLSHEPVTEEATDVHTTDAPPTDVPELPEGQPPGLQMDPRVLPALHLLVEDLRFGELDLGRARLEAHPVEDGIEIEQLQVSADLAELTGRGRWLQQPDGPASSFELRLSSRDLPAMLLAAGFDSTLQDGRSRVELVASWPGGPTDFDLSSVRGTLDLLVEDGSIPEARPGAGRLLGLISLGSLPRRLQLDFRDVFGQGLSFDRIQGRFDLADGRAYTDGLVVSTSAADITISGQTDMNAQTYDQEILVRPGFGSTLPILGALAAGPGGAAAGLALQGLLGRPLGDMTEIRYRVTGPWDAPEVIVLEARAGDEQVLSPALQPSSNAE